MNKVLIDQLKVMVKKYDSVEILMASGKMHKVNEIDETNKDLLVCNLVGSGDNTIVINPNFIEAIKPTAFAKLSSEL